MSTYKYQPTNDKTYASFLAQSRRDTCGASIVLIWKDASFVIFDAHSLNLHPSPKQNTFTPTLSLFLMIKLYSPRIL